MTVIGSLRNRAAVAADRVRNLGPLSLECDRDDLGEAAGEAAGEPRPSPSASLRFAVGGDEALLCYGRPSARGRTVFGGLVPWGELWRTGANEPTVLHLPFRARLAGLRLGRGRYALYTVPDRGGWRLVVNRSHRQWGLTRPERGSGGRLHPNAYTERVRASEVGRVPVETEPIDHVETLLFRAEPAGPAGVDLLLEWADVRVRLPLRRGGRAT